MCFPVNSARSRCVAKLGVFSTAMSTVKEEQLVIILQSTWPGGQRRQKKKHLEESLIEDLIDYFVL